MFPWQGLTLGLMDPLCSFSGPVRVRPSWYTLRTSIKDESLETLLKTGEIIVVIQVRLGERDVPCEILKYGFLLVDRLGLTAVEVLVSLVRTWWRRSQYRKRKRKRKRRRRRRRSKFKSWKSSTKKLKSNLLTQNIPVESLLPYRDLYYSIQSAKNHQSAPVRSM